MNAEVAIGFGISTFVALIMEIIGIAQIRKSDEPVGFYTLVDPPRENQITDMIAWNRQHGLMWILYGICIELGFLPFIFSENDIFAGVCYCCGILVPLPIMILYHHLLVKKYYVRKEKN